MTEAVKIGDYVILPAHTDAVVLSDPEVAKEL